MSKLEIEQVCHVPLTEISGLCLQGDRLLAIGDESYEVVSCPLDSLGSAQAERFERRDLYDLVRDHTKKGGSQWEGIAADAAGQVFVLQENPGHLFVFDRALERLLAAIELRADWDSGNSRGEGLLLLSNGHVVLVQEKDPPRLVELGPPGASAAGVSPALSRPAAFPLPSGPLAELASWQLCPDDLEDLSDLAAAPDGALYLLSDQARSLIRIDAKLSPGAAVSITGRWDLPKKVKKPEGLVMLPGLRPLVAIDRDEEKKNLFLLSALG